MRGMRVSVSPVVNLIANGMAEEEIINAYPYLEPTDIRQALRYAEWLAEDETEIIIDANMQMV